ncbi:MAG: beta strand repeat-containing protein [Flavobacteriales bacterium]
MATIQNARDQILQAAPSRLDPVVLPSNIQYNGDTAGNHTGNLNGLTTQSVIDAAFAPGGGDITADVLANSATAITVTSSNLFSMPGTGQAGTFIGAGGLSATDSSGNTTFAISASNGDAFFGGNVQANSFSTFDGTTIGGIRNTSISLSSIGALLGGGGGQITNGASIGNLNAGNITTGTLSANRIGANSINASHIAANAITASELSSGSVFAGAIQANAVIASNINVSTLSAMTANLGNVNAGSITGSANIDINGQARFNGVTGQGGSSYAGVFNTSGSSENGLLASGIFGVTGQSFVGGGTGVRGQCGSSGNAGVSAVGSGGAPGLRVTGNAIISGSLTLSSSQTISNLTAGSANFVPGANVGGSVNNSDALGGFNANNWGRFVITANGTANAGGSGWQFGSQVSGVETAAIGGNQYGVRPISDRRKKVKLKKEKLGLEFVMKIADIAKTYEWKTNRGQTDHGFIAQEMKLVLNGMGIENDSLAVTHHDGIMGINYTSFIGILAKSDSEINKKVEKLEDMVKKLSLQVVDLKKQLK